MPIQQVDHERLVEMAPTPVPGIIRSQVVGFVPTRIQPDPIRFGHIEVRLRRTKPPIAAAEKIKVSQGIRIELLAEEINHLPRTDHALHISHSHLLWFSARLRE
jgi:hypothetical protein